MSVAMFGARLRELRIGAGLTQADLAEHAGVQREAIARWEAGRREPSWGNILALAAALGVSTEAFTVAPTTDAPPPSRGRPRKADAPADAKPAASTKPAKRSAAKRTKRKESGR